MEKGTLLYWRWWSFMRQGVEDGLRALGLPFEIFDYQPEDWENDEIFLQKARKALEARPYAGVFSVNFHPLLSGLCEEKGLPYTAWIYDAPLHIRDLTPLRNSCNRLWFFDRNQAEAFAREGIHAAWLPLAADPSLCPRQTAQDKEISFVGQLYQADYAYQVSPLSSYGKGYLEGILAAQGRLSGAWLVPELLSETMVQRIDRAYRKSSGGKARIDRRELEFLLARESTGRERYLALSLLSRHFQVHLYGADRDERLEKVRFHPYVDYQEKMPQVFAQSKINLNISLKCIPSGVPLRVFDILACRGFVLPSYSAELPELFELGKELVVYQNLEELADLARYYLTHDQERQKVAENGWERCRRDHSFPARLRTIFEI